MLKMTFLSHSCFLFDDGKYKVIVDPFLTGNPNSPVKANDVKVDYVIITHGHGDHIGDGFTIAKRNDATIIAMNEISNYASEQGLKAHFMCIGGGWNFPFGRVKLTIAHHSSANKEGRYMGEPAGVIIKMGGKTIYHAGDTGLFLDMKLIGDLDKIDVFLCPIGDNYTMGVDDAVKAVEFINPELVVPMHYNTNKWIQADPIDFKNKVESIGKKAKIMEFGECVTF